jgi:hypothetical protein
MKHGRKFRRTAGIAGLVFGLLSGGGVALAEDEGNFQVVPPNSNEFGNTYGEWSARWWQWLLSVAAAKNPNLDTTGAHCAEAQTGQVWFLAATFGGSAVTRSCTIPGDKDLFFSPLNGVFGEGVGDCTGPNDCDPTALRKPAAANVDNPQTLEVSIDNVRVQNLAQNRVTSPVFSVFFPQDAIFGLHPGTHSPLVSDGYWVLLKPLSRGAHTIRIKGVSSPSSGGLVIDVTYHLTVTK